MENNSCVLYHDFLSSANNAALYQHTLNISAEFESSRVLKDGKSYLNQNERRSKKTDKKHFEYFHNLLANHINPLIPEVVQRLKLAPFEVGSLDIHLTAHNHGDFIRPHKDNADAQAANRALTFVYYYHSEPKMFTGGQLLFLQNKPHPLVIEPVNNSIVFFEPSLVHAVHPVNCPGQQFEHSRFTLNGWVRKAKITEHAL